jgi:hypothetical protein
MEVVGLVLGAVGVVGVAALYFTSGGLQTLKQIDAAHHLEKAASSDDSSYSPLLPLGSEKTVRIHLFLCERLHIISSIYPLNSPCLWTATLPATMKTGIISSSLEI